MRPATQRHRHTLATAALTTAVLATLAACTSSTAAPTQTATTSVARPSVAATSTAIPGPATISAPTSEAAAITAANASLTGYYQASFTSGAAGGTELDHVTPWVIGAALKNEQLLATYLRKKQYRLEGTPTPWTLDTSRSTATQTTTSSGTRLAYGAAHLVGCAESTNRPVGSGAPAWTTKGRRFPRRWTVIYDASKRQWLVDASTVLSSTSPGAPSCG